MDEFVGFKARSNICLGVFGVYLRGFCLPIEGALQAMKQERARQRRRRQTQKRLRQTIKRQRTQTK